MTNLHSYLVDNNVRVEKSEKIFYNKYPYRIKWLAAGSNWDTRYRHTHNTDEMAVYNRLGLPRRPMNVRSALKKQKSSFTTAPKILNQARSVNATVYFENEEDFLTAQTIYTNAILNVTVPALDNLVEIQDGLSRAEEIRKCLYWRKYRHKIKLKYSQEFQDNEVLSLFERLNDMDGVHISSGLDRVYRREKYPERYSNQYYWSRHSWENMSIGFEHENDAAFISLMLGDHVKSWKTAVLLEEVS